MLTTLGARSFSAAAPKLWNGPPVELRQATSLKRECALRSSRIKNSWHMMKNKCSPYFVQRYPIVSLETWWGFFLEIFLLTPQKKIKTVNAPGFWKNTQN